MTNFNADLFLYMKRLRRRLHAIAEPSWGENATRKVIVNEAKSFNCIVKQTSDGVIVLFFDFKKDNCIVFRAEQDGLPMTEKTGLEFSSKTKYMHACGHDGHMAICLGLAKYLTHIKSAEICLHSNIAIVFEPAEEGVGGMQSLLNSGILRSLNPVAAYALHILPQKTLGKLYSNAGAIAAGTAEADVTFFGESAHIATIQKKDALAAACAFQVKVSIFCSEIEGGFLRFGTIKAGTARNIICDKAILSGSMRYFDNKVKTILLDASKNIAKKIAAKFDCLSIINLKPGIPPVVNDFELFKKAKKYCGVTEIEPMWIGDDFGQLKKLCPCLYVFLGAGQSQELHTSFLNFDESLLLTGLNFYIKILSI